MFSEIKWLAWDDDPYWTYKSRKISYELVSEFLKDWRFY